VFSVIADIGSGANMTSLSASLVAGSSNLEGQQSYQSASSGAATGASRQVNNSPLTVATNTALNTPVYIAGAAEAKIASFVLTASSAQPVLVRTITLDRDANAGLTIQNLKIMVAGEQFGATQPVVGATETGISFSGSEIKVPAGGSTIVDVFADIITNSTVATYASVIDFKGWSAVGANTGNAITFTSEQLGQSVEVSSGPTVTVATGSNTAPNKIVVMGSTNNELFTIRLSNNGVDDVYFSDLTLYDTITSGATNKPSFTNITLYAGGELIGGPLVMESVSATTSSVTFALDATAPLIPKNSSRDIVVKGDVSSISSGGSVSGSSHVFTVLTDDDIYAGPGSNGAVDATMTGAPIYSNTIKVYQTKLSLSSSVTGATVNRARTGSDDLATINFGADSALQLTLGTVSLKFTGNAVTSGTTAFTVDLIDANTNAALGSASQATCTPAAGNSCSVTFYPQFIISAGDTKAAKVRVNSSSFINTASAGDALSVLINAASDVQWYDGSSALIPVESTVVPFTVASMSYE
jgi:hypothetical protein